MANSIIGSFVSSLIEKLRDADPAALSTLLKEHGGMCVSQLFCSQSAIGMALGTGALDKTDPQISQELAWINTALADIGDALMRSDPIEEFRTIK